MSQHTVNIVVVERIPLVGGHTEERVRAYEYEFLLRVRKLCGLAEEEYQPQARVVRVKSNQPRVIAAARSCARRACHSKSQQAQWHVRDVTRDIVHLA